MKAVRRVEKHHLVRFLFRQRWFYLDAALALIIFVRGLTSLRNEAG